MDHPAVSGFLVLTDPRETIQHFTLDGGQLTIHDKEGGILGIVMPDDGAAILDLLTTTPGRASASGFVVTSAPGEAICAVVVTRGGGVTLHHHRLSRLADLARAWHPAAFPESLCAPPTTRSSESWQ